MVQTPAPAPVDIRTVANNHLAFMGLGKDVLRSAASQLGLAIGDESNPAKLAKVVRAALYPAPTTTTITVDAAKVAVLTKLAGLPLATLEALLDAAK